jgi:hypothetical protein
MTRKEKKRNKCFKILLKSNHNEKILEKKMHTLLDRLELQCRLKTA